MRYYLFFILMTAALSWSFSLSSEIEGTLSIEIRNIQKPEGMVWIGIYDSESSFLVKEKAIVEGVIVKKEGRLTVDIPHLKYGDYAIAIFHDENNNGQMDRNIFGIPSEPFAFSRRPRSKWRLPRFSEVRFTFDHPQQKLSATLKKW